MENSPLENVSNPQENLEIEVHMFGGFLVSARESTKDSQVKLAMLLGISPQILSQWEIGKILPDKNKLPEIAEAYQVDLLELERVYTSSKEAFVKKKQIRTDPKQRRERLDSLFGFKPK